MTSISLTGRLDARLSRWLWLVKMFLAIPHFVVLAALSAAWIISVLVAGAAILINGRYPRTLFDFNVGVLRYHWRVGFYVYAALGTDTYPPFTLRDADYPAQFGVAYPERSSRALVALRWIMAVPHLAIVGLLLGGLLSLNLGNTAVFSVLNVIVVVAGAMLLLTGKYPAGLFDVVIGLNRWIYRAMSYAAFLRDEYPPFRLDAGGTE